MSIPSSRRPLMRSTALATGLALVLWTGAAPAQSQTFNFALPREPLSQALRDYARISGQQIIFTDDLVAGRQAPALRGALTAEDALAVLLKGTDLAADHAPSGALMIRQKEARDGTRPKRLGDASQASPSEGSYGTSVEPEEIVVTARKREERLQETPVAVTAVNTSVLAENSQLRLQDYASSIPGLTLAAGGTGLATLAVRGITTFGGNPVVAVTVDGVPIGATTSLGFDGDYLVDLDPSDLQRIELLRGPQGTLYGAASLGGLLNYITVDPSTTKVSGNIETGVSGVYNSAQLGYVVRGGINIPITDTFAIYASGSNRRDPGYVNNVSSGQNGVNRTDADSGFVAALWQPTPDFSAKFSALVQYGSEPGSFDIDQVPGLGPYDQKRLPNSGNNTTNIQLYTATFTAHAGDVDITSITGYNINHYTDSFDFTSALGGVFGPGALVPDHISSTKLSEEFRVSGTVWTDFDWLVGAFYTDENSHFDQKLFGTDLKGNVLLAAADFNNVTSYSEYAFFADLTYHVTEQFDIQVGGREAANDQVANGVDSGPYEALIDNPSPFTIPEVKTSANAFTYLVTPRYKFSPDLMVYGRFASGYRPGGPNTGGPTTGAESKFDPDMTYSYEVGAKGDLLGKRIYYDFSAYYVDWRGIQFNFVDPHTGFTFLANGSAAKSDGVELSLDTKPMEGMTVAGWVAYDDAVLTQAFPENVIDYGAAGNRLPLSSQISASISAEQEFPLTDEWTAVAGGSANYIGERLGLFQTKNSDGSIPARPIFPAYIIGNLHAGVRSGPLRVNLYVNNVGNVRGIIDNGLDFANSVNVTTPRTVGITVSRKF